MNKLAIGNTCNARPHRAGDTVRGTTAIELAAGNRLSLNLNTCYLGQEAVAPGFRAGEEGVLVTNPKTLT